MKKFVLALTVFTVFLLSSCDKKEEIEEVITYDDRSLVSSDCMDIENIDDWQPVWCDEFSIDGLPDDTKWSYDVGGHGWGNQESQYYTDADIDNAYIENGVLSIKAIKESFSGSEYTSARLVSKNQGDWEYGRIQIMAKLPHGKGLWSALWMLPTDRVYGGWPDSGEIDIMEYVGFDPGRLHGTLHSEAYNHSLGTHVGFDTLIPTAETQFHLYEMIWEPGTIDMYIDGELLGSFGYEAEDNVFIENSAAWPFDQRFHLIMNIAVGGSWGGSQGIDDSIFPQTMDIDYVRVFQMDYIGLDNQAPSDVDEITLLNSTSNSLKIMWEEAIDDIMISEYLIFIDDNFVGDTTVNSYLIDDLEPSTIYKVSVFSVDFAGNYSHEVFSDFSTQDPFNVSERIEAEAYDFQQGIQIQTTSDIGGGDNIGWTDAGDYLEYTVEVLESGYYTTDFRIASDSSGGQLILYNNNTSLSTVDLPVTGGWQTWETTSSSQFYLEVGTITFKIVVTKGGFNLNYFEFKRVE